MIHLCYCHLVVSVFLCITLGAWVQGWSNVATRFGTKKGFRSAGGFGLVDSTHRPLFSYNDSPTNNKSYNNINNNIPKMDIYTARSSTTQHRCTNRQDFLHQAIQPLPFLSLIIYGSTPTLPANALIKGNAPPTKSMKPILDKPKCTNVEECQEQAELRSQEERVAEEKQESRKGDDAILQQTKAGTRYRDLQIGSGTMMAQSGDEITIIYKVLKLGKRSYDGISGEGTVIFSRGYGLEDDEKEPRDKFFATTLGRVRNIAAFNDAVEGMKVGGLRRFAVLPEAGWRKPGQKCDGGPGGTGSGGDLKTDYIVVPTATMVNEEACLDQTKLPFPTVYAEQRRMAQRFDQSLIMEVELVQINR